MGRITGPLRSLASGRRVSERNRYRTVLGAARAASRAGNESRARDLFKQLAELGKDADSGRDGLEEARQSLSRG
jgi:uncharacterized protein HemY